MFLYTRNASFGGGQQVLPNRNFARFLLMNFILFCLIMRTAYQGKQFEFMQQDIRRPDVETIEEMIENNFTLFVPKEAMVSYKDMEFTTR